MFRKRRQLVFGALGVSALAAAATAWRYWPEHGFANPCRARLPDKLAHHEIVRAAWDGIDAARVWDCHAHLIGSGDSGGGAWLNPELLSVMHPVQFAQRLFFFNAGCAHQAPGRVDESYIERMHNLLDGMPPGCKLMLLAFDRHYTADGEPAPAETSFYIPNAMSGRFTEISPP